MIKELKIRGEFHWDFKDFFVTELLSKKYKLKRVKTGEDLTIGLVEPRPFSREFLRSPIKLLVSGENLYYQINIFKLFEYVSKKTKLRIDILNRILPRSFLNLPIGLMRKGYYDYVKNIARNSPSGEFAIIMNSIKGKNILNLPFFLQVKSIRENINKLENKRVPRDINDKKFCCIIISNESSFERIDFFKKLSRYRKVDCFGKTRYTNSDNSLLPKCWSDNPQFYSQYKFVICFENSFEKEQITEKLPNAMLGGAIPIYRGAPNVGEYFNTESFINFDNHNKNYGEMIKKIVELDKNDKKYSEFIKRPWITQKNKLKIKNKEKELRKFLLKMMGAV